MCVEEGCHMATKYNTTFSWKQSKKYRSSQSGICVFNKNVLQISRILWVQTKVMGREPKCNPIKFKYFLCRGDVGWHAGEMLSILQILDPLLAISLKPKGGSSCPGSVSFQCSLPSRSNSLYSCFLSIFALLHPSAGMLENLISRCSCLNKNRKTWLWWQYLRVVILEFYFIFVNTAHLLCFCGAAAKIQMIPCFKDTKIIEAFLVNYLEVVWVYAFGGSED